MDGRVHLVYTNIGRGHPFYLDGIRQLLPPERLGTVRDVFDCCHGVSGLLWRTARWLYASGSSCGGNRSLYSRVRARTDYTRAGPALTLMGAPLRRAVAFRARLNARQYSGALARAAERGWGRQAIDGFARAAAWLAARA